MRRRKKRESAKKEHKEYLARREESRKKDFIRRELHEPAYPMGFYIWERHRDFPDFMPKSVLHDLWLVEQEKSATKEKARLEAKIRLTKVKDKKIAAVIFEYATTHSFASRYEEELAEDMVKMMSKKDVEKALKDKGLWAESLLHTENDAKTRRVRMLCDQLAKVGDLGSVRLLTQSYLKYWMRARFFLEDKTVVTSLVFRSVSPAERTKLGLAGRLMDEANISNPNRMLAMAGLALNKRWMEQLPTDLNDKRQRPQIDFLRNLVDGLRGRHELEVGQAMHLLPKEKKK